VNYQIFAETDIMPREHLARDGAAALADVELLALVLGTGISGKGVMELAAEVLECIEKNRDGPVYTALGSIVGLGPAKVATLSAILEFGRRIWGPRGKKITCATEAFDCVRHYANEKQEKFLVISLNGAHEALNVRLALCLRRARMAHRQS
jgi:DNA repair protein RadC